LNRNIYGIEKTIAEEEYTYTGTRKVGKKYTIEFKEFI
jgi:hypothetical protein